VPYLLWHLRKRSLTLLGPGSPRSFVSGRKGALTERPPGVAVQGEQRPGSRGFVQLLVGSCPNPLGLRAGVPPPCHHFRRCGELFASRKHGNSPKINFSCRLRGINRSLSTRSWRSGWREAPHPQPCRFLLFSVAPGTRRVCLSQPGGTWPGA